MFWSIPFLIIVLAYSCLLSTLLRGSMNVLGWSFILFYFILNWMRACCVWFWILLGGFVFQFEFVGLAIVFVFCFIYVFCFVFFNLITIKKNFWLPKIKKKKKICWWFLAIVAFWNVAIAILKKKKIRVYSSVLKTPL